MSPYFLAAYNCVEDHLLAKICAAGRAKDQIFVTPVRNKNVRGLIIVYFGKNNGSVRSVTSID